MVRRATQAPRAPREVPSLIRSAGLAAVALGLLGCSTPTAFPPPKSRAQDQVQVQPAAANRSARIQPMQGKSTQDKKSTQAKPEEDRPKQDKPTPARPGPGQTSGELKFLDGVMMTIDNEVVLDSEVEDEFEAVKSGRTQNSKQPLSPREERRIYNVIREKHKNEAIRARATLSTPGLSSNQIRDYVQRVLNDQEQEQIRQYGSLSRMKDELKALGHSKFMLDRKRREKVLNSLKTQERRIRLRDRMALMITPKMLRDHYRKVHEERSTTAVFDLGLMYFPPNVEDAATKAKAAVSAWRTSEATSEEIAERFGARPLRDRRGLTMTTAKASGLRQFVLDFIGAAKSGEVSDPVEQDNGVWVLKLLRKDAGRAFRFDDPRVQDQLRLELLEQEIQRIEVRDLIRDRRKVHVWDPQRPRRK